MATALRLFTQTALHLGQTVVPTLAQSHYVTSVMRRAAGDSVLLFNGRDGEWRASIVGGARKLPCRFEIETQTRPQSQEPDIWLVFAPLKRHATDLIAQKATELGVSALLPVITERTQAERVNLDRLTLIAIEAAEQCERLSIPIIHPPQPLLTLCANWPAGRALYFAAERVEAPRLGPRDGQAALLIGPEGGFHPEELDAVRAHPFVHAVSLGPRILRAETAAIAGLALLLLSA